MSSRRLRNIHQRTGIRIAATLAIVALAGAGCGSDDGDETTSASDASGAQLEMLVVTGALIALVLVVLVGNTTRTLQGVGWR